MFGADVASEVRIQYGGSVAPDNVDTLMGMPGASRPPSSLCMCALCILDGAEWRCSCVAEESSSQEPIVAGAALGFEGRLLTVVRMVGQTSTARWWAERPWSRPSLTRSSTS
eukprot:3931099-Rhodomonas_salina.1